MMLSLSLLFVASITSGSLAAPVPSKGIHLPSFFSPHSRAVWNFPEVPPATPVVKSLEQLSTIAMARMQKTLAVVPTIGMLQTSFHQDAGSGMYFTSVTQMLGDKMILNSVAGIALDKFGNILAETSSWAGNVAAPFKVNNNAPKRAFGISAADAISIVAKILGVAMDAATIAKKVIPFPFPAPGINATTSPDSALAFKDLAPLAFTTVTAQRKLYLTPAQKLVDVWDISLPMSAQWVNVFVDSNTGKVVGSASWSSSSQHSSDGRFNVVELPHLALTRRAATPVRDSQDSGTPSADLNSQISQGTAQVSQKIQSRAAAIPPTSYRAVAVGNRDPRTSPPSLIQNPFDQGASPLGWHDTGNGKGSQPVTVGNNVVARDNSKNDNNPNSGFITAKTAFDFDFAMDDTTQQPPQYKPASITQAFFIANAYHDILSKYGFTEAAGNFQVNNLGRGGVGNDPVIANVQDGSGTNNANFASPPDGQAGFMRMFIFTSTNPDRDGAFENAVILHELTHGLSNRLTGGPANANCLQTTESGGLGEGWSDSVALTLEMTAADTPNTDKAVGQYVSGNQQRGVRQFPYSTSLQRNPHTLADAVKNPEVHAIGEVWASMLFEVYWNLVGKLGFEPNLKDNARSGKGNTVFLQAVVDGMKLQPCNPTFVQARDAILKADVVRNKGANQCEIIKGFAKRGLGINTVDESFVNNFDIPANCK